MAHDAAEAPAAAAAAAAHRVTEDEAALYDRQIRLWGLEAQNRLRTASVLVLGLNGTTTELVKNLVLAGVGSVAIADDDDDRDAGDRPVTHTDLAAGFFWREDDLGKERIAAALPRIQALNPLCQVRHERNVASLLAPDADGLRDARVGALVVAAERGRNASRRRLIELDRLARAQGVKFYAVASRGFDGWAFSDLGDEHEYVVEKPKPASTAVAAPKASAGAASGSSNGAGAPDTAAATATTTTTATTTPTSTSDKVRKKRRQRYVGLEESLRYDWRAQSRREARRNRLSAGLIGAWALWEYEENRANGAQPRPTSNGAAAASNGSVEEPAPADGATLNGTAHHRAGGTAAAPSPMELEAQALLLCRDRGVDPATIWAGDEASAAEQRRAYFEQLCHSLAQPGDFAPTCAVLGGVVAQDVLNALGLREEPLCNWFVFDGLRGQGVVHRVGAPDAVDVLVGEEGGAAAAP